MLETILAVKQKEVQQLKERASYLYKAACDKGKRYRSSLSGAIRNRKRKVGVIAEVKKASPSKGVIRPGFDPAEIAWNYRLAGVEGISVLTDQRFFQGDPLYLPLVKTIAESPVLRKDFILDEVQIYESHLLGADCILLIVKALAPQELNRLAQLAREFGMEVLIEVHDERELEIALKAHPDLLGINNRNLETFETSLKTTEELVDQIPREKLIVSESGISSPEDVEVLASFGVDAILVGEHFMRQEDLVSAVHGLVGRV